VPELGTLETDYPKGCNTMLEGGLNDVGGVGWLVLLLVASSS